MCILLGESIFASSLIVCIFFFFHFESVRFSTHECEKNTNHMKMTPQKLNSVNAPEGCVLKNYAIFLSQALDDDLSGLITISDEICFQS